MQPARERRLDGRESSGRNESEEQTMKLYNSIGPNPRIVRMFMAECGLEADRQEIDLRQGENREAAFMKLNPTGTLPALALDDGVVIAEVTAICEYLAEQAGGSSLIGETPLERAETRMWTRRIDLGIVEPLANGFRYSEGLPLFSKRITTLPEAAEGLKRLAREKLAWLDGVMAGRAYICGARFSLADILLFCFLDFGSQVGQPLDEANGAIRAWFDRVAARPSAAA